MQMLEEIDIRHGLPAVFWRKGEMYRVEKPGFFVRPSAWSEIASQKPGEWHVIDAKGRYFDVERWERIRPFGGFSTWWERLLGYVFLVPILSDARTLTLEDFKKTLEAAAVERFRHDEGSYAIVDIREALPKARTYADAIGTLPELM